MEVWHKTQAPLVTDAKSVLVAENRGFQAQMEWADFIRVLFHKIGLEPGDKLVVRKADGSLADIGLPIKRAALPMVEGLDFGPDWEDLRRE